MLLIDKNTEEFLKELDNNFSTTPQISEGVSVEIQKAFEYIEKDWDKHYSRIKKGLKSCNNKIVKALSTDIPKKYIGRPRPINRLFPYAVSHNLINSWEGWAISKEFNEQENRMTITISTGNGSEHATRTNRGDRSTRDVNWLHWADDVFGNPVTGETKRRGRVPDIRSVLLGYYS